MTSANDWRGAVGDVWAAEWRRTDRSFAGLAGQLDAAILAAAPDGAGRALDIGCGAGATSLALAGTRPDLIVTGIDVSPDLVEIARVRAAGAKLSNARFAVGDLESDGLELPVADLMFSRHGVMFTTDPIAMFARLRAAAVPGAALTFSCFRAAGENPWGADLVQAATGAAPPSLPEYQPGPFAFADPGFVTGLLEKAGWHGVSRRAVDYDYIAGVGADPVSDAVAFFTRIGPVANALRLADGDRDRISERLAAELARHRQGDRVVFPAAAWLWSARA